MHTFNSNLVVDLFGLLSRVEMALKGRSGCGDAVIAIQALASVFGTVENLTGIARESGLHGLAMTISPMGGNGIGDSLIWPALRKSGLHNLAEELTALTNSVRASLYADKPVFVPQAESNESKVAGLQAYMRETYSDLDEEILKDTLVDFVRDAGDDSIFEANKNGVEAQLTFLVSHGWTPSQVQAETAKHL